MKLLSFRILNYRSIVDSGWCELSPDNITGIIGQNESGKTSVLEALKSFYSGEVSEEIIRSDLSNPLVSCCFTIDPSLFEERLSEKLLPEGVIFYIRKTGKMCLLIFLIFQNGELFPTLRFLNIKRARFI